MDIRKPTELYTLKGEFYGIYIYIHIQKERKKDFLNLHIEIFLDHQSDVYFPRDLVVLTAQGQVFFPLLFHLALRQLSLQIPEGSFILSMTSQTFGIPELWAEVSCWLTMNKPWTDF